MKWIDYAYYNSDPLITTIVDMDDEMVRTIMQEYQVRNGATQASRLTILQDYLDKHGHNMDGRRMIARKFHNNRLFMGPDPEGA